MIAAVLVMKFSPVKVISNVLYAPRKRASYIGTCGNRVTLYIHTEKAENAVYTPWIRTRAT